MKTLSLLAAAAVALSLSLSGTTASAATYKPNLGPVAGAPTTLGAVKNIYCTVKSQGGGQYPLATLQIVNDSHLYLAAGMRIHVNILLTSGKVQTKSFLLSKVVPPAHDFDTYAYGQIKSCTAQVNLLAKKEPVPTIPPVH